VAGAAKRLKIVAEDLVNHFEARLAAIPQPSSISKHTTKLKEEADQLAKLAQSIPADVDKAAKGQVAQDLAARSKQIEKLSKQLRHDISL
jgi:hypothetical protein